MADLHSYLHADLCDQSRSALPKLNKAGLEGPVHLIMEAVLVSSMIFRRRTKFPAFVALAFLALSACDSFDKVSEDAEIERIYWQASDMVTPGMTGDQLVMGMLQITTFVSTECARERVEAEMDGEDQQTIAKLRQWEARCKREVADRFKREAQIRVRALEDDSAGFSPEAAADDQPHAVIESTNPPAALPQPNGPEEWADACAGYFAGSTSSARFALQVTNRPLEAEIIFSDNSHVKGQPVIAVGRGRLKITDYQTGENWWVTCQGNRIILQPPDMKNGMMFATRTSQPIEMAQDGGE